MRLKYQLRGLGLGMVLTALLMGISTDTAAESLTDAQIKERAKALGMMENTLLSELETTTTETNSEEKSVIEEATTTEETTTTEQITTTEEATTTEETTTIEEATTIEASSGEESTQEESEGKKILQKETKDSATIVIQSGDGSGTVSRKLEQAGLISSAIQYDKYLAQNGYDKKLRIGTYEIKIGATEEEIAKQISAK